MESGRNRRVLALALALVGLAAIIGVATRAETPAGGGSGGGRSIGTDVLFQYVLLLALVTAIAMVALFGWQIFSPKQRERLASSLPPRGRWWIRTFIGLTAVLLVVYVLMAAGVFNRDRGRIREARPERATPRLPADRKPRPFRFDWVPVIVVGSLALVGSGAAGLFLVRRRGSPLAEQGVQAVSDAIDESLDDLLSELDPRSAVISAYARMERALASSGLPRLEAEAPREYLARVLVALGATAESAERLTALFERAKFSTHEIDLRMKDDAIDALRHLREELRGGEEKS